MAIELSKILPCDWYEALAAQDTLGTLKEVCEQVAVLRTRENVYPEDSLVFNALWQTPLAQVRCIILGQDPYINPGQAMGLAFSVPNGTPPPPSLRNIFIELQREFGGERRTCTDLTDWTKQGVLLLNSVLTVRAGESFSHQHLGWQAITRTLVAIALMTGRAKAMLLWGQKAKQLVDGLDMRRHFVLTASHPVAMTNIKPFAGCGHFSLVNYWLERQGDTPINW